MIEEMFKEQQGALGTLEPMGWGPYSLVSLVYDRTLHFCSWIFCKIVSGETLIWKCTLAACILCADE